MFRHLFLLALLAVTTGCAIVPDDIAVPDDTQLVSYNKAVTGGDALIGKTARWGGTIVSVENKPQKTFVEVVNFPLNHYGRPNTGDETVGRFKVEFDGFVDPINFEEGRSITFVGTVKRPISGMVGEQPYMYPLLAGENYHIWRESSPGYIHPMYFDYRLGWYSPFYYSYYRPYMNPWAVGVGFSPVWYSSASYRYRPMRAVSNSGNSKVIRSTSGRSSSPPPIMRRPAARQSHSKLGSKRKNLD